MKPAESFSVLSSQRRQNVFIHPFWESSFHSRTLRQDTLALSLVVSYYKSVFTHILSNRLFLIWLLTTTPNLKYLATLPCNLSLMACFADINVSHGSVATYARCGGMFSIHLTAILLWNLAVKKFGKIWQNYGYVSVAPFFGSPCTVFHSVSHKIGKCGVMEVLIRQYRLNNKFQETYSYIGTCTYL